jgi:hypothetical protein
MEERLRLAQYTITMRMNSEVMFVYYYGERRYCKGTTKLYSLLPPFTSVGYSTITQPQTFEQQLEVADPVLGRSRAALEPPIHRRMVWWQRRDLCRAQSKDCRLELRLLLCKRTLLGRGLLGRSCRSTRRYSGRCDVCVSSVFMT